MNKIKSVEEKLSLLWIVVMFSMVFADIVGFLNPGTLKDMINGSVGIQINQEMLLIFAVLIEIPIIMIFLSRVLNRRANRLANIIAGVLTTLFVVGGGSPFPYYVFFASVEVICMLIIMWTAWKWKTTEKI